MGHSLIGTLNLYHSRFNWLLFFQDGGNGEEYDAVQDQDRAAQARKVESVHHLRGIPVMSVQSTGVISLIRLSNLIRDVLFQQNNLQKYRSYISNLERENMMLLNDVKRFETQVGILHLFSKYILCSYLSILFNFIHLWELWPTELWLCNLWSCDLVVLKTLCLWIYLMVVFLDRNQSLFNVPRIYLPFPWNVSVKAEISNVIIFVIKHFGRALGIECLIKIWLGGTWSFSMPFDFQFRYCMQAYILQNPHLKCRLHTR